MTAAPPPGLRRTLLEWGRIDCVGFGGPPAHVALEDAWQGAVLLAAFVALFVVRLGVLPTLVLAGVTGAATLGR